MGEHGHYWFRDLHDTTLHVPLLMLPPPRIVAAPRRVPEVVRLMDVAPTILDWLGLPKLAQAEGASLAPLAAGSASGSPGPLVAVAEPEPNAFTGRAIAVRRDAWKLIRRDAGLWASDRWSPGGFALFDLASDPAESVDLASTRPDVLHQLGALLPPGWEKPPAPPLAPPSAGAERVLEDRE
jgi:arylsulfatase A-like enzyme